MESINKLFHENYFNVNLKECGAVISAAKKYGFTSVQQQAIKDAYNAVGITDKKAVRIVLDWKANPSDLDSHLTGPVSSGNGKFHIYYYQKNVPDISGSGSEAWRKNICIL
jgi:uncharacterized protein YfaP (DUF2135 family)